MQPNNPFEPNRGRPGRPVLVVEETLVKAERRKQRAAFIKRLLAELLVLIAAGFVIALFMYQLGFRACCNASAVDFAIALTVGLIAIWALWRAMYVLKRDEFLGYGIYFGKWIFILILVEAIAGIAYSYYTYVP